MAQYRQLGVDRLAVRIHHDAADRIPHRPARIRRQGKPPRRPSLAALAAALVLVLLVALAASGRLSPPHQGFRRDLAEEDGGKDESEFHAAVNRSAHSDELNHGRSSGNIGRDSRHGEGQRSEKDDEKRSGKTVGRLYNEGGRAELDSYKEDYEASVQDVEDDDPYDEYDDDIDVDDKHDDTRDTEAVGRLRESDGGETRQEKGYEKIQGGSGSGVNSKKDQVHVGGEKKLSGSRKKLGSKRKSKRHKFSSSSCEIKFLNSTAQIVEPLKTKKFAKFSLQYAHVENRPNGSGNWEPRFAGHRTLEERERSFYAHDQTINCGFVKGPNDFPSTGFDIAENDTKFMSNCHIAVSSCIFGNSDRLRSPFTKMITRFSRKNVCFVMFMDDITLQTLLSDGQKMENGFIGFWKVVVVSNLPYPDMRRVGKIPKFLSHRLFPSARYSIWLDSKLRLQSDPSLILEYFLWRRGFEYAISNHYHRHCVWEEVIQNKKLNKYNHTVIDQQFEFYQSDGLKRFDPSDPNKLLPSYVPEGSFIVREHTPMSNLFSCLWFNEVDRFTPRDQLSFAYTYLKLRRMNPRKPFYLNMFKDCERRAMAKLFRHRAEEKRSTPPQSAR